MGQPLLTTKLYMPPLRPQLVNRSRLTARLDNALRQGQRLILVSAKAGSGKTTLVSSWLQQRELPVLWLSLDDHDNNPQRFLRYLAAALQRLGVEIAHLDQVQSEMLQPDQAEILAGVLMDRLTARGVPLALVFDDYHLIDHPWIHAFVGVLVEHLPPETCLILVTRVDPPLPLSRIRGRGQVTEVRDYDLRFTAGEASGFLNDVMQLGLPSDAIAALERRTEGWIAGLQMAAISLQGRHRGGVPADFVEAFSGTHRYILDYLTDEVIGQQTPAVQDFLLQTSVLDRLCGDLCDAIRSASPGAPPAAAADAGTSGMLSPADAAGSVVQGDPVTGHNSQSVLLYLEQANLFVTPLDDDRHWYRYHHLFADLLRSTLRQRRTPAQIRELHRRASLWHLKEGLLEEAMDHAIAAQDFELAAAMIEDNIVSMLARSEVPLLLGWIDKLPPEVLHAHPWIDVYRANALALTSQVGPAEALLADVEARIAEESPQAASLKGHIAAIRAYTANLQGDAGRVAEMAALADGYLADTRVTARGMAAYALSDALIAADDVEGANRALATMLGVGEYTGQLLMSVTALCDMATVKKIEGRLHEADAFYDRAYQTMAEHNGLTSRVRCAYEFGLADLLLEWNQLDEAYEHAQIGLETRQKLGGYLVVGDLVLARILRARGNDKAAREALDAAERLMQTYPFQLAIVAEYRATRVVQWLEAGDTQMADYCAEACTGGSEPEQIALVQLSLARGRVDEALRLLGQLRPLAEDGGRTGRLIQILALQALALAARGHHKDAADALHRALALAEPSEYVRLFLQLGTPFRDLLSRYATEADSGPAFFPPPPIPRPYVARIVAAFEQDRGTRGNWVQQATPSPAPPRVATVDALTSRELDVLRLLADGLTNKAIAEALVVTPGTVKQHLKNIYGKLDVHSRTQAVARGREFGYL